MTIVNEFKAFVMRGNVIDMAVGIIIGAAFGKIVGSVVEDVLMPPLGLLMGGVDFSNKVLILKEATLTAPAVLLRYGVFINAIINFLIVALAIFLLIKGINALKKKEAVAPSTPPVPTVQEILLTEIRDLLKNTGARK